MKKIPIIYTITVIEHYLNRPSDKRCWGWYPKKEKAEADIKVNNGDMHETTYNYLVLEEMPAGIMGCVIKGYKKHWYTWSGTPDHGKWKKCAEPEWSRSVIGYGMG